MSQALTPIQKQNLEKAESRVKVIVREAESYLTPLGIDSQFFLRATLTALWKDSALVDCEERSFKLALLKCAATGLIPDGESAVIVAFKRQATLIPMVHGMIDIIRRNVPGIGVECSIVREWDEFEYVRGTNPVLRHVTKPLADGHTLNLNDIRTMTGAYAVITMPTLVPGASPVREAHHMWKHEIEQVRSRVKSSRNANSPWVTNTARMYEKTVLRAAFKRLPSRHQIFAAMDPRSMDDYAPKTIKVESMPAAAIMPPKALPI